MSKALCGNFIDENDKDAYFHKEIKRLQRKNDNLEKKFYDLTQIKDENDLIIAKRNLSSLLAEFSFT